MIFKTTNTRRGFRLIEFNDLYENQCQLQESSLATEGAIWFGTKVDRMHLTQAQVQALMPVLQNFVRTGYLGMTEEVQAESPIWNHAYDFAAEVLSQEKDASDVTLPMVLKAFRERLDRIENNPEEGGLEPFDCFDTHEIK